MKNTLFYYYKLSPDKVIKKNNYYYFELDNFVCYLYLVTKPLEYINELLILNKVLVNTNFYLIVSNVNGQVISIIDNKYYILLKGSKNTRFNISEFYYPYYYAYAFKLKLLDHSDWGRLWSEKVDYFEYQKDYIKLKYNTLYHTLDYFIGLSENAISYFYAVNRCFKKTMEDNLVICRRRIDFDDINFYNPLNIVIDNKSRDSAEYLKYLFINNDYTYEMLDDFLVNLNYSKYQYGLLIARLLFPSHYFDVYEKIVNGGLPEKEIFPLLNRTKEYESFLRYIYKTINKNQSILQIDWLDN